MPIYIRNTVDPLSHQSFVPGASDAVIVAQSDAGRVLRHELERYCRQQIQGRSFLVAGHRGAGKTTTVADVLWRVTNLSEQRGNGLLRPLPVFLHGPSLFTAFASDRIDKEVKPQEPGKPADSLNIEAQAEVALKEVMLGLHRATVREFVRSYRSHVLAPFPAKQSADAAQILTRMQADRAELASQFEIEILEDPPASRLREFWEHAGALFSGVLHVHSDRDDGGTRELVALNGICNAHQRVSGALSGNDKETRDASSSNERSSGYELKAVDILKPMTTLLSGAAVGAGAAVASHRIWLGALLGGIAAVLSSGFMRRTSSTNMKRQRTVDMVFIPDLTLRTLDRILPTLLERLRDAGLAPVFVIDELDKINCLPERIVAMVHYFKKLFAETVFTCFLTDRGYLEYLRVQGRSTAYSVAYSYFSHPLLIAFEAADLDSYLSSLLRASQDSSLNAASDPVALVDLEVWKWVLRHRSQMHALDLMRELMSVRGEGGRVDIPEGLVRTGILYTLDVTFQVAIELALTASPVAGWKVQRPGMRQTLLDAVYYVTREWLKGAEYIDLEATGDTAFASYLMGRMNLSEVIRKETNASGDAAAGAEGDTDGLNQELTDDDLLLLKSLPRAVTSFLHRIPDAATMNALWPSEAAQSATGRLPPKPGQSVLQCLLLGESSIVYQAVDDPQFYFRFRYYPSGDRRDQSADLFSSPRVLSAQAQVLIDSLVALERDAWAVLRRSADPVMPEGQLYQSLTDELRLLPTSPAWSQVKRAIQILEQGRHGVGNVKELSECLGTITQFTDMLRKQWQHVDPVLVTSAFLGGVQREQLSADAARFGLQLLAAALDFISTDTETIVLRVAEARRELESEGGFTLPLAPEPVGPLQVSPDLGARMDAARALGTALAAQAVWSSIELDAWVDLEHRITVSTALPNAAALLCAARGVGPGAILGIRQERWTLEDYTRLLSVGLSRLNAPVVPLGLVALALRRLGADTISPYIVTSLASAVVTARRGGPDESTRLLELLQVSPSNPRSDGRPPMIAFVVTNTRLQWTASPSRGMIFLISEADARVNLEPLGTFFIDPSPYPNVFLVWEPGRMPEDSKEFQALRKLLPSHTRLAQIGVNLPGKVSLEVSPDGAERLLASLEMIFLSGPDVKGSGTVMSAANRRTKKK